MAGPLHAYCHDVFDFNSICLNIYKNHKISMICVRILQYSLGCLFVNGILTKTSNIDERFESFENYCYNECIFYSHKNSSDRII